MSALVDVPPQQQPLPRRAASQPDAVTISDNSGSVNDLSRLVTGRTGTHRVLSSTGRYASANFNTHTNNVLPRHDAAPGIDKENQPPLSNTKHEEHHVVSVQEKPSKLVTSYANVQDRDHISEAVSKATRIPPTEDVAAQVDESNLTSFNLPDKHNFPTIFGLLSGSVMASRPSKVPIRRTNGRDSHLASGKLQRFLPEDEQQIIVSTETVLAEVTAVMQQNAMLRAEADHLRQGKLQIQSQLDKLRREHAECQHVDLQHRETIKQLDTERYEMRKTIQRIHTQHRETIEQIETQHQETIEQVETQHQDTVDHLRSRITHLELSLSDKQLKSASQDHQLDERATKLGIALARADVAQRQLEGWKKEAKNLSSQLKETQDSAVELDKAKNLDRRRAAKRDQYTEIVESLRKELRDAKYERRKSKSERIILQKELEMAESRRKMSESRLRMYSESAHGGVDSTTGISKDARRALADRHKERVALKEILEKLRVDMEEVSDVEGVEDIQQSQSRVDTKVMNFDLDEIDPSADATKRPVNEPECALRELISTLEAELKGLLAKKQALDDAYLGLAPGMQSKRTKKLSEAIRGVQDELDEKRTQLYNAVDIGMGQGIL
jgi:hypothetical protein